jgi:hypothetical protein
MSGLLVLVLMLLLLLLLLLVLLLLLLRRLEEVPLAPDAWGPCVALPALLVVVLAACGGWVDAAAGNGATLATWSMVVNAMPARSSTACSAWRYVQYIPSPGAHCTRRDSACCSWERCFLVKATGGPAAAWLVVLLLLLLLLLVPAAGGAQGAGGGRCGWWLLVSAATAAAAVCMMAAWVVRVTSQVLW